MPSHFLITALAQTPQYVKTLRETLDSELYEVVWAQENTDFLASVTQNNRKIDCLLLEQFSSIAKLFEKLKAEKILLPTVLIEHDTLVEGVGDNIADPGISGDTWSNSIRDIADGYHSAVVRINSNQLRDVTQAVRQAINGFVRLPIPHQSSEIAEAKYDDQQEASEPGLEKQQKRLSEKLRERLGYLGVYYKRNPQNFFRNMNRIEKRDFLEKFRSDYREIILGYFSKEITLNSKIDSYVNAAFFADIAVAQVVEVHMDLMDEFSKQLQLEGRNEDILLDYRLTLIDVIAHLCEMYRRSIPRETDV